MITYDQALMSDEFIAESLARLNVPTERPIYKRKSAAQMTILQRQRFLESLRLLIKDGWYNHFVNLHANMEYRMHSCNMMTGTCDLIGGYRFLAWHRVYLLEFEKRLRQIDKRNFVPYWRWNRRRRFPIWLKNVKPKGLVNKMGMKYNVTREFPKDVALPTKNDIKGRLEFDTYRAFTHALEGTNPYGAHNQVHMYVGGTMSTMYSPADPIFWMHHAECDRLWYIWQLKHPDQHPPLLGADAVMDPWPTRYKDVSDLGKLPYTYRHLKV